MSKTATKALGTAIVLMASTTLAYGAEEKAEIYQLIPDTSLAGLIDPFQPDRTDIEKAWPKEPSNPDEISVGWTEITLGNPFFVELIKGAERTAEGTNIDLDVLVAEGDLQTQCSQIDAFVSQGKDIIVVDPTDTLGVGRCINRAVDEGIPVVAIGTVPADDARILTTITPNPYDNGFKAGAYTGEQAGADPIVSALIVGVLGNSTSESRLNGMVSGIVWARMQEFGIEGTKEDAMLRGYNLFQDIKTTGRFNDEELQFQALGMGEGKWTEEGGLAAAEDLFSAHGDKLTHILADNDWMGLGTLRAMNNANLDVIVATSADGNAIAIKEIKAGNLQVTGTFSGEQMGVSVVKFIDDIFNNGLDAQNLPLGSFFPAYAITKENADDFIDPNPENKFYKYEVSPVLSIPEIREQYAASEK